MYKYLFESLLLVLLDIYAEVKLLDHIILCITFQGTAIPFPQRLYHDYFFLNHFCIVWLSVVNKCQHHEHDTEKDRKLRVNNLISDSAPQLLKQSNIPYMLTLLCLHTTPHVLRNKCVVGNDSYDSSRFYMGQILLKIWTTYHGISHLKEILDYLPEFQRGQSYKCDPQYGDQALRMKMN